ncbi:glycerol-3-phosphate dehydrogenase/oxidase [Hymenobacter koreensis]|uniref:Glycerol-3-phosphate dehydrogenase/oxidase n=1 Tax=Hymenobacter koreensis TaxID=1084523 RepID=A0ABP8IWR0_9BACT
MPPHSPWHPFQRETLLQQLTNTLTWDLVVVGGGATGLGVALDGLSRGYSVLLLERDDFAKGTSSRSTKLVHGGVRYLAQGDVALVREALFERSLLLENAPHLVSNQTFVVPAYDWWNRGLYTLGLKAYDVLAGHRSLGASVALNAVETLEHLPGIRSAGLRGGVLYHDGQFDDARLAINLAQTAVEQGGTVLNHFAVDGLLKDTLGRTAGVQATDRETGTRYELHARCVVNATGVFVDDVLQLDAPGKPALVRPSQGIHLVLDARFLPGPHALMIPKTDDGRVLFGVPWHGQLVLGTTDTPITERREEPQALETEIDFVLRTAGKYLTQAPTRHDVQSVFAGLRPLAAAGSSGKTKELSRSHKILVSGTGLITITGGKWTTYRRMAQDALDRAIKEGLLPPSHSRTASLHIHGAQPTTATDRKNHLYVYGTDQPALKQLMDTEPELGAKLDATQEFTRAEVVWAARYEMARTVEDVLARRVRLLFLNAAAAMRAAPVVAEILAQELGRDQAWQHSQVADFTQLARGYLLMDAPVPTGTPAS